MENGLARSRTALSCEQAGCAECSRQLGAPIAYPGAVRLTVCHCLLTVCHCSRAVDAQHRTVPPCRRFHRVTRIPQREDGARSRLNGNSRCHHDGTAQEQWHTTPSLQGCARALEHGVIDAGALKRRGSRPSRQTDAQCEPRRGGQCRTVCCLGPSAMPRRSAVVYDPAFTLLRNASTCVCHFSTVLSVPVTRT